MSDLRITEVKTFLVGGSWRNWLIVKIETDGGIHGVGEGTLEGKSKTVEQAVRELERYLIVQDPFPIEKHFQEKNNPSTTKTNLIELLDETDRPIKSGKIGIISNH